MLLNRTNSYIFEPYVTQSNSSWYPWNISKETSCRFDLHFTQRRREFFLHTLHLSCFSDVIWQCFVSPKQTSDETFRIPTWLENGLPSFEYFKKIALTTFIWKARRSRDSSPSFLLIRYNTRLFWGTTSTIQANWDHHQFFIGMLILLLVMFWSSLVRSGQQNPCSGCNSGTNLVVVVEYTFFQLYLNSKWIF